MVIFSGNPLRTHVAMFTPTILGQGDEEQKTKWLEKCLNFEIIGSYSQTELGHGSNLKRLETIAEYDSSTDTFVMNTPTKTSWKWWPGGLGHTSNHAMIMAQLYVNGKHYGLQSFVVQV